MNNQSLPRLNCTATASPDALHVSRCPYAFSWVWIFNRAAAHLLCVWCTVCVYNYIYNVKLPRAELHRYQTTIIRLSIGCVSLSWTNRMYTVWSGRSANNCQRHGNELMDPIIGITSPAVGDHLLAVVHALRDRALEQRPGARRVRLQIVAERCAHQNPGKRNQTT